MPIRITGMNSGMDTESIINQLASARSMKVENIRKEQTKLSWKTDAWKSLNSKIYSFYSESLFNMRFEGDYSKKTTKVSDTGVASVITGGTAVNGSQSLKVNKLAKAGYMTGAEINATDGKQTKIADLGVTADKIQVKIGNETKEIALDANSTLADVESKFKELGLNANFDAKNNRFFISSKETGADNNFQILNGGDVAGLGLDVTAGANKVEGSDAEIELNGATFHSSGNTFEINGLTITALKESADEVTVTTETDTSGIYDMIKGFIKKYSELVNEMDKLYNAENTKNYKPLSQEEKDAMSDKEVEDWEKKIKDSILRRDSTIGTVSSAMKSIMAAGIKMEDGRTLSLSDFGIETLGYFEAKDNEKSAYHIMGDKDDPTMSTKADKLQAQIAANPADVTEFFTKLSNALYKDLGQKMAKTEYSSSFKVYNDVQMEEQQRTYKSKIEEEQKKLDKYVDSWYSKFTAMEKAMASLNSKQNAILGMFPS